MNFKKLALAAAAGTTLLAAAPVFAQSHYYGPSYRYQSPYRHHYYRPRAVVYPAPVYYAPEPVYYAPEPVYYAPAPVYYPPRPVIYGRFGHGRVGISIGL
jgi:hypothetical protein